MLSLLILTFGLLAGGSLLALAASSASLASSMDCAVYAAQEKLEYLLDEHRQNAHCLDLQPGEHEGTIAEFKDAAGSLTVSRYRVSWSVLPVPDPRTGFAVDARLIRVTVFPVAETGDLNFRSGLNKPLSISAIAAREGLQ